MGKVEAFSLPGFEVLFYSSDHHPPHFHVRRPGEWEIRVYFMRCKEDYLDYELKWPRDDRGPDRKTRKRLLKEVLENKAELLEEWEKKVDY